jgi:hypothetical protein
MPDAEFTATSSLKQLRKGEIGDKYYWDNDRGTLYLVPRWFYNKTPYVTEE